MEGPEGAAGVVFSSLSTCCEVVLLFPVAVPLLNTNSGLVFVNSAPWTAPADLSALQ